VSAKQPLKVDPKLRLIFLTGGSGAGKTQVANRLIGRLEKQWRLVQLDGYVPWGWKDPAVHSAGKTLRYFVHDEGLPVLFDGAIAAGHLATLCSGSGLSWPSTKVRVIQLLRAASTARERRMTDPTLWSGWDEDRKENAIAQLEKQVPGTIEGAAMIDTDPLTESQVFEAVLAAVLSTGPPRFPSKNATD